MSIRVSLKNVGPLNEATAVIRPLTILVGTNNTGKTFFATVLHKVVDSATYPVSLRARQRRPADIPEELSFLVGRSRRASPGPALPPPSGRRSSVARRCVGQASFSTNRSTTTPSQFAQASSTHLESRRLSCAAGPVPADGRLARGLKSRAPRPTGPSGFTSTTTRAKSRSRTQGSGSINS